MLSGARKKVKDTSIQEAIAGKKGPHKKKRGGDVDGYLGEKRIVGC